MRDSGDAPARVQLSTSTDRGLSWSVALKSEIPNTASVAVIQLLDGRWAFVGNMINDGRYQLELWISTDEGISWSQKIFLENNQNKNAGYSYPCLIQSEDGLLHVSYSYHLSSQQKSIKYVKIDPSLIK
jgi:predicted neuraminidase